MASSSRPLLLGSVARAAVGSPQRVRQLSSASDRQPSAGATPSASSSADASPPTRRRWFSRAPRTKPRSPLWRLLPWIPVAAFITNHVCSIGNVTGASMSPTFNGPFEEACLANSRSDVVLLNRYVAAMRRYKVGDIVTLISPIDPNMLLTKRIVALEDDVVRTWAPAASGSGGGRWVRIKVPKGHVWVEGDAKVDLLPGSLGRAAAYGPAPAAAWAKGKSRDSREFGPVAMGLITSRIDFILWPPARFGRPAARPHPPSSSAASHHRYPPSQSETSPLASQQYDDDERLRSLATQVHPSLARILDEIESKSSHNRIRAHPHDSRISPYVDWTADGDHEAQLDADESPSRRIGPGGKQDQAMRRFWNGLSRGGTLGDDAKE
ncbi:hypothetical protein ACQY0O_002493 [Thecaphora frezii]